jgi:flagellar basal body-associated protein FliL
MSIRTSQDNFVAYVSAAVVVVLLVVGTIVWYQFRQPEVVTPTMSYTTFGPYQVQVQELTISAGISVQTETENSDWVKQNRAKLEVIFQSVLAKSDPQKMKSQHGIEMLQDALKDAANQDLQTDHVMAVLLTDFMLEPRRH